MAIGCYFAVRNMSPELYDETIVRLDAAGAGSPAGRLYHFAFTAGDGIHVFDVFDSPESFEAFGQTLMPILADLGIDPGTPSVAEIRNIITAPGV